MDSLPGLELISAFPRIQGHKTSGRVWLSVLLQYETVMSYKELHDMQMSCRRTSINQMLYHSNRLLLKLAVKRELINTIQT